MVLNSIQKHIMLLFDQGEVRCGLRVDTVQMLVVAGFFGGKKLATTEGVHRRVQRVLHGVCGVFRIIDHPSQRIDGAHDCILRIIDNVGHAVADGVEERLKKGEEGGQNVRRNSFREREVANFKAHGPRGLWESSLERRWRERTVTKFFRPRHVVRQIEHRLWQDFIKRKRNFHLRSAARAQMCVFAKSCVFRDFFGRTAKFVSKQLSHALLVENVPEVVVLAVAHRRSPEGRARKDAGDFL
mmetsp:Transcript_2547/g.9232  ORF Transcript_2547/g.9232 Transcript_2547/m.9232 type:complete len:242 (+) Transcript_2547:7955-8680(+)